MKDDIARIANLLRDLKNKGQAEQRFTNVSLAHDNLQPKNPDWPAIALFETEEQIRLILETSHFIAGDLAAGFPDFRFTSFLQDPTGEGFGNGTVLIYVTGHGLATEFATELAKDWTKLADACPKFAKYPISNDRFGRRRSDLLPEGGQIVAFTKFLSVQDILANFKETCRRNQVEENTSELSGNEPLEFRQRHLILVVDACFSGHWIKNNIHELFNIPYIKDTNISITIQTATAEDQESYGYFFTPLFCILQAYPEAKLNDIITQFRKLKTSASKLLEKEYNFSKVPIPQFRFYETDKSKPESLLQESKRWINDTLYYTHQGFRFFTNPEFYAYFALLHTQGDIFSDSLKTRPLLRGQSGRQFMRLFTQADSEISIQGMKLTSYSYDDTYRKTK
jgi:hypothetical protein